MKAKGELINLTQDYATGLPVVTFRMDSRVILPHAEGLLGKKLSIEMKEWREKRSLNQNDFWHSLLSQLAGKTGRSMAYVKNKELRRYGQFDRFGDKLIQYILPEEYGDMVDEYEYLHLYPTDHLEEMKNGKLYRLYYKLKGSHELNTEEMARLLEGTIEDCKEQGIYDERMYRVWSTGD